MHRGDIREAKADINARVKLDGEPHFCPLHVPWKWRNSWSFFKGHFLEEKGEHPVLCVLEIIEQ